MNKVMSIFGDFSGAGTFPMTTIDNHPFIYPIRLLSLIDRPYFVKINPDWSLSEIQEFKVKDGTGISNKYLPLFLFYGLDKKLYALSDLDLSTSDNKHKIVILDLSVSPPTPVSEVCISNQCEFDPFFQFGLNLSLSPKLRAAEAVTISNRLYLLVPTLDAIGRLHSVERAWVSVFDVTSPSQPRFVGKWRMSGLNGQLHFPDASEAEDIKIYADAGLIE
ncbi:MAG: hypothetical protein ACK4NX_01725, partial [Candidatus Paceibacteria bacterium]